MCLYGIENVIMSGSVENVNVWFCSLWEVVVVYPPPFPSVHVLHSHGHPHGSRQCSDVEVVTLVVHGLHLLQGVKIPEGRRLVLMIASRLSSYVL